MRDHGPPCGLLLVPAEGGNSGGNITLKSYLSSPGARGTGQRFLKILNSQQVEIFLKICEPPGLLWGLWKLCCALPYSIRARGNPLSLWSGLCSTQIFIRGDSETLSSHRSCKSFLNYGNYRFCNCVIILNCWLEILLRLSSGPVQQRWRRKKSVHPILV